MNDAQNRAAPGGSRAGGEAQNRAAPGTGGMIHDTGHPEVGWGGEAEVE